MNYRQKTRACELLEIVLSLIVIFSTAVLVFDWEKYEIGFLFAFGAAAILLFVRGIRILRFEKGGHPAAGLLCFVGGVFMIAFLVGSLLTIFGGLA